MKPYQPNFLQSDNWALVNQTIGHKVIQKNHLLMIVKDAKRGRYLEIPGAPKIKSLDKIREIAKNEHCVFARIRFQIPNTTENRAWAKSLGLRPAPMHLHAEHTVIIDLEKTEEELMKNLRRQTRYEVRRAEKLGIKVEKYCDDEIFQEFHQVQAATAARQHFVPPNFATLEAEHTAFKNNAPIYVAKDQDGQPIAYGLIIKDGEEAEYFEAASTDLNRTLPGAYALLWQAIKDLKKDGFKRFNLWGIAPPGQPHHRYAGVTTFKTGFGGETIEFLPAQDLIINRPRYLLNLIIEKLRKKVRHL